MSKDSVRIVRVPILPMQMVNAHLILGPDGVVLVDAGLPGSDGKIERALAKEGREWKDIKLIVVTHAHVDHAGSAAIVCERSGAPILAHAGDAKHYSRETPMTFCPTGWFGRLFIKTPLMFEPYVGFEPDLLLARDDRIDLGRYGLPGTVRHTPGHTAGSISVELGVRQALVGDLLASGILLGGSSGRGTRSGRPSRTIRMRYPASCSSCWTRASAHSTWDTAVRSGRTRSGVMPWRSPVCNRLDSRIAHC